MNHAAPFNGLHQRQIEDSGLGDQVKVEPDFDAGVERCIVAADIKRRPKVFTELDNSEIFVLQLV